MISDQLKKIGITDPLEVIYNPSFDKLYEEELLPELTGYEKSQKTEYGALNVKTGIYTGRSPKDKYIVKDGTTEDNFWWTSSDRKNDNKPISQEVWEDLKLNVTKQLSNKKLYIIDAFCGANKDTCLKVRFVMEVAWQAHFVKNMFIRPSEEQLKNFVPDFHVINGSKTTNKEFKKHNMNSETFIAFNLTERIQLIGGTWYGGEMKKGMFAVMNYLLPQKGIASMHCSANKGINDDTVALFFGLSGTGKTTLSTDPKRSLIGDDEHGWDDDGIFNFEGGCYAKTIDLSEENEPDIYRAIRRDALLENVYQNEDGTPDYFNTSKTENGRVSYPIYHIDNWHKPQMGAHPKNIIFLTCDAFGVLPPVSKLSSGQAMYHFLSGYTAKVAGTERGITEPTATFSPCFGGPFLTLHPLRYAELLKEKMNNFKVPAYLVNTGWVGASAQSGAKRISLPLTRKMIHAILDGTIEESEFQLDPYFGVKVPKSLDEIGVDLLIPANAWKDKNEYDKIAKTLVGKFNDNFSKYNIDDIDIINAGPRIKA